MKVLIIDHLVFFQVVVMFHQSTTPLILSTAKFTNLPQKVSSGDRNLSNLKDLFNGFSRSLTSLK